MTGISYRSFSCNQDNQQLVNGVSKCMTACWCRYNSCDVHFICKKFVLYTERECCRNWCTHCVFLTKYIFPNISSLNLQLCRTMLDIITLFQVILIVTARKTKKWMIWKIFNRENNQSTFVCMLQKAIFLAKTVLTKKKKQEYYYPCPPEITTSLQQTILFVPGWVLWWGASVFPV